MTQFGKDLGSILDYHYGIETAGIAAGAACGAFIHIKCGDCNGAPFVMVPFRFDEKMGIGFLDIAIEERNGKRRSRGQINSRGRLPRTSFTGGYCYCSPLHQIEDSNLRY
jgi:hypothetical protein